MRRVPSPARNVPEQIRLLWCLLLLAMLTGCTNFYGRGIQYQIEHRYAVRDPQFLRSMGSLLEPGILASNRVTGGEGERIAQERPRDSHEAERNEAHHHGVEGVL